jgi:hypothetical protein
LFGIELPKIKQKEVKEEEKAKDSEEEKKEEMIPLKVPPKVPITFRACKSLILSV